MTVRAFVAVDVPPLDGLLEVRRGLDRLGADLKVVAPENVHLTLAFLGDVPESALPEVQAALADATGDVASFRLHLEGVGTFPPGGRAPRVVWIGATEGARALEDLAGRVRDRLEGLPVKQDRKPFRAHVTLARSRSPRGGDLVRAFVDEHADAPVGDVPVDAIHLVKSTLSPKGPRYETLATFRLEG